MNIKDYITHQNFGVLSLLFILSGIFLSPVIMSIGMIGLALNVIVNKEKTQIWSLLTSTPAIWLAVSYFMVLVVSGIYSDNIDWYLNRLLLKLPFLVIPIGILSIPKFDKKVYHTILYVFSLFILMTTLVIGSRFIFDFESISALYKVGKVIDTPVMHIRYSLMIAYSFIILIYLYFDGWKLRYNWEKYLQIGGALVLFGFIHILAVRSGMVALYSSIGFVLLILVIKNRMYIRGFIGLILLLSIAYLGVMNVPSLHNKFHYTLYSIRELKNNNDIARLSDSYRLASIQAGIESGNSSPIIGVGLGDVKDKTALFVNENYPELAEAIYTPQCQYILVYASAGLLGLLVFIGFTMLPLIHSIQRADINLMGFHIIATTSFIVEQTLESQVGIAFYFTFSMMGILYYLNNKRSPTP